MTFRTLAKVLVAAAALFALAGCTMGAGAFVIGSIIASVGVPEGTPFHVVLYADDTEMDPYLDYGAAARAFHAEGAFPSPGLDAVYDTVNYQIDGVAAGDYSAFAWIDMDTSGSFDPPANIRVPDTGLVDVDITVYWGVQPG